MSTEQKFEKFLTESGANHGQAQGRPMVGAPPGIPSIDDVVAGDIFNIEKQENIDKLNAYLSAASTHPTYNPYFIAKRIQDKLSQIGLQFKLPTIVGEHGTASEPMTQFGGIYGYEYPLGQTKQDNSSIGLPGIVNTDGLSHRIPGGLKIVFSWVKFKGYYTLDVHIAHGEAASPSPIKEDELHECKECGKTPCTCKTVEKS